MPAIALIAAVLLLIVIAVQISIPRVAAARIRSRLVEGGGVAEVRIAAFPAIRLLRAEGDRLVVRGRGLEIGLARGGGDGESTSGISTLDGFADVDIELTDFRTGPFAIDALVLTRSGSGSYAMATRGSIDGADLVRLGEGALRGFGVDALVGVVARGTAPLVARAVPISVEIELISSDLGLRVGTGGGSIAGYPAGPIATAIAAAVARRLEIAP